ncbi:MAG: hypothetical protein AB7K24_27950 [Gemmataceae bacterium]
MPPMDPHAPGAGSEPVPRSASPEPTSSRALVVSELRQELRRLEESQRRTTGGQAFTTGLPAFDAILPAGGWQAGSLVEWLCPGPGSGAGTLALQCAHAGLGDGTLVVIDESACFYPPA